MEMCYPYSPALPASALPALPASARLDNFQRIENGNPSYMNDYYNEYDIYYEPVMKTTSNVYHDLISSCRPRQEEWKSKVITDWTDEDTVSWLIEYTFSQGFYGDEVPYYNFKVSGIELRNMRLEEMIQRMAHPSVDQNLSKKIAHKVFEVLEDEKMHRKTSAFRYKKKDPYMSHDNLQSEYDLDENKLRSAWEYQRDDIGLLPVLDSRNDSEDHIPTSSSSFEFSCGNSESRGDKDNTKLIKKPPGRPKGKEKNKIKRLRSESVPEFLWNMLTDENKQYLIVWEDYSQLKFRFIKPDEVAKLWGQMKQNDNMTFEKFSRAMRYHYRQKVLVSVPSARLVYQFGSKGPDFKTQNPNFVKVKSEVDLQDMSYS